jgi:hypothetical protein
LLDFELDLEPRRTQLYAWYLRRRKNTYFNFQLIFFDEFVTAIEAPGINFNKLARKG